MKTAISIPDSLFIEAEKLAKSLHLSRSELYQQAIRQFLKQNITTSVTDQLNDIYSKSDSDIDPVLADLQAETTESEDW